MPQPELNPDRPLNDPAEDQLGYAPFAESIAKSISSLPTDQGLVMALYGPWGSGKSSVLGFIKFYLENDHKSGDVVIIDFNPWWFTGHDDLTLLFFHDLLKKAAPGKKTFEKVRKSAAKFVQFVGRVGSKVPLPYASASDPIGQTIANWLSDDKTISERKAEVEKLLRDTQKKFVVFIDDVDRLAADEIRQIFRMVKSVANFPNVLYLLAFDKEVAIGALQGTFGFPGESYLEKIIQVPFELPLADAEDLHRLLFAHLDALITTYPPAYFDQEYRANVFHRGLADIIDSPRQVGRLVNTLRVTYPALHGEVNFTDFVAIEAIRVFAPNLYDTIRRQPDLFTGISSGLDLERRSREERIAIYNRAIEAAPEKQRASYKRSLIQLFPKTKEAWENSFLGSHNLRELVAHARICAPDYFSRYFRFSLGPDAISEAEMREFIAAAHNKTQVEQRVLSYLTRKTRSGRTKVPSFFEKLRTILTPFSKPL